MEQTRTKGGRKKNVTFCKKLTLGCLQRWFWGLLWGRWRLGVDVKYVVWKRETGQRNRITNNDIYEPRKDIFWAQLRCSLLSSQLLDSQLVASSNKTVKARLYMWNYPLQSHSDPFFIHKRKRKKKTLQVKCLTHLREIMFPRFSFVFFLLFLVEFKIYI